MKKIFVFLLLGIFLLNIVSAETKTYPVNIEFDLKVTCINVGYCSNESVCNINVENPDDSLLVSGQNMTNQVSFHNYTITPEQLGKYGVKGFCLDGDITQEIDFPFLVSPDGNQVDTGESMMYIWILIILLILLGVGIYFSIVIPYGDLIEFDEEKNIKFITEINKEKYAKLIIIWITSGIFLAFLVVLTGMINNYIQFTVMKILVTNVYTYSQIIVRIISVVISIILFVKIWKDILLNKQLVKHGKVFIEENIKKQ